MAPLSAQTWSGQDVPSLLQDLDKMQSVVVLAVCAVLQFVGLDAVYVDIRRFRGYIQNTHNDLRSLEGAADMKYMVSCSFVNESNFFIWVFMCVGFLFFFLFILLYIFFRKRPINYQYIHAS